MWRSSIKNLTLYIPLVFNLKIDTKSFNGEFPDLSILLDDKNKGIDIYSRFLKEAARRAEESIYENSSTYVEVHHIVPRHAGGLDNKENLTVLLFNDHVIAHYVRWVQYNESGDKIAYSIMSAENVETRKIKASIAGSIGGPKAQKLFKDKNKGWYNTETQRILGIKGAEINRQNQTGGFDPLNIVKANEALNQKITNPLEKAKFEKTQKENLKKGLATQKEKNINVGNPVSQRLKSIGFRGVVINNKRYYIDTEQRTYLSDTTLDYYLEKAPKKPSKKKKTADGLPLIIKESTPNDVEGYDFDVPANEEE